MSERTTYETWRADPGRCHEEVIRRSEAMPCGKTAVAVRLDVDGRGYPVCARHTRGPMLPLSVVIGR